MGLIEDQVTDFLSIPFSYCHWAFLLNFIEQNKHRFTDQNKKDLLIKLEEYRSEHNSKHPTDFIRREDTNPNVYSYLEIEEKSEVTEQQLVAVCAYKK